MARSTTSKRAGIGAAAVFFAAATAELARIVLGKPWRTFVPLYSDVMSATLAALWAAAAIGCLLGRRRGAIVAIFGAFAFLPHFVVTRAAGSPYGIAYLVALPISVLLSWLAFGRELHLGHRGTVTSPEPPRDQAEIVL